MPLNRAALRLNVSTHHLLESRLHLLAAIEAMSDVAGLHREYLSAVELRETLDELFISVEEKSTALADVEHPDSW